MWPPENRKYYYKILQNCDYAILIDKYLLYLGPYSICSIVQAFAIIHVHLTSLIPYRLDFQWQLINLNHVSLR